MIARLIHSMVSTRCLEPHQCDLQEGGEDGDEGRDQDGRLRDRDAVAQPAGSEGMRGFGVGAADLVGGEERITGRRFHGRSGSLCAERRIHPVPRREPRAAGRAPRRPPPSRADSSRRPWWARITRSTIGAQAGAPRVAARLLEPGEGWRMRSISLGGCPVRGRRPDAPPVLDGDRHPAARVPAA